MVELTTPRLILRPLVTTDAPFILTLLNDADFIRFIGDRKVRNLDDARAYIEQGPMMSYREHGFGLLTMESKTGVPIGMCGLIQRDYLPDPDIGFALLPGHRKQGYCEEAARAVLRFAARSLNLKRIGAIVQPDNEASLGLLHKLGFVIDRAFKRSADEGEVLLLAYWA